MKKTLLIVLFVIGIIQMYAQTEQGMWTLSSNVFSNSTFSTDRNRNETNNFFRLQSEAGFFLSKRQLLGARFLYQFNDNKRVSIFSSNVETRLDFFSEASVFYRYYPMPKKRIGLFGESQVSLIGNSKNTNNFFNQFKAQLGAGIYFFLTDNIAFELNFLSPIYHTTGLDTPPTVSANFGIIRNFKSKTPTQLPKLEDTYLFVRNFYYGLGAHVRSGQSRTPETPSFQIALNTGFFIGSHWLIDFNYTYEDFESRSNLNSFGDLRLESAFFIRLNKKGTYLRPAASFKLENGRRIRSANPDLDGFQKYAYVTNLEIAQFIGDQIILGGGASMVLTKFDLKADHYQYNATTRFTYFITKDFAIEYTGAFFINDKFVNNTDEDLRLTLSSINSELKIRHFFFQK